MSDLSEQGSEGSDGAMLWQVEKDLQQCQENTRAISGAAETISQALQPSTEHSKQMERIFQGGWYNTKSTTICLSV